MSDAPSIVVVAGPNGAGKTTAAPFLLRDALAVREIVLGLVQRAFCIEHVHKIRETTFISVVRNFECGLADRYRIMCYFTNGEGLHGVDIIRADLLKE